jgi:hypothetical protein
MIFVLPLQSPRAQKKLMNQTRGRGRVYVHGILPYTREATVVENGIYVARPTAAYQAYIAYNADLLIEALRSHSYAAVLGICLGGIKISEWEMTDAEVLEHLLNEELDRRLSLPERERLHIVWARYPSCETESDVQRFHEAAVAWLARRWRSYNLQDARKFRISFSCDRDRTGRSLRAVMNQFGLLSEEMVEVCNAITFPKSIGARLKQVIFNPLDALLQLTSWGKRKKYQRRLGQIRDDNLVYEPGYDLIPAEGVLG